MEIILLVIALLILGKVKNIGNKNELRFIVGLVLGITYFFIWPYVYYYIQLLSRSEMVVLVTYVFLLTIAMLVIRLLLVFESYEITVVISFCFFIVFWVISYSYDIEIKDKIADQTDYFSNQLSSYKKIVNFDSKEIISPMEAYTVTVPVLWEKYKQTSTGLPYFKSSNSNGSIIEFRPKCYDTQILNITNIVEGTSLIRGENESANHQCYHWQNNGYACKIIISNNIAGITRIRWLGFSKVAKRVFELDFVIQNAIKYDLKIIDSIFESVRLNKQVVTAGSCTYSVDWF